MNVKVLRLFQLILLLGISSMCMTSCTITSRWSVPVVRMDESHRRPQHVYYYYPDARVYYDPGPSLYFWFENNSWQSNRRLPSHIRAPQKRVRFKSDADRPYNVHEKVVQRFHSDDRSREHGKRR